MTYLRNLKRRNLKALTAKNTSADRAGNDFPKNAESGFTIVEMIISMALFLIVSGVIFSLAQVAKTDGERVASRTDVVKNSRLSVNLFGRDAVNAGLGYTNGNAVVPDNAFNSLVGVPNDSNSTRDYLTPVIVANNVNPNNLSGTNTDTVSFVWKDFSYNSGNSLQANSVSASGSTARLALSAATTVVAAGDIFLFEDTSGSVRTAVMVSAVTNSNQTLEFATGDALGINQSISSTNSDQVSVLRACNGGTITQNCSVYPASLTKLNWVSYFANPNGDFIRRTFGNNRTVAYNSASQIVDTPLAYGVENLHFRYLLEDGTMTDNPFAGPDQILGNLDDNKDFLNKVRQVTIDITLRGTQFDRQTSQPLRIQQSTIFATRNITYDAS